MPRKLPTDQFVMSPINVNVIISSSQRAWGVSQCSLGLSQTCSPAGGNVKDRPPAVCTPASPQSSYLHL